MKVADRYLTSWSIVEEYKVVFIASESENSRKSWLAEQRANKKKNTSRTL